MGHKIYRNMDLNPAFDRIVHVLSYKPLLTDFGLVLC